MNEYLAPALVVAIVGLILQGIKAALDLYDRAISRKFVRRQSNIALFVALMQIVEAANFTSGEVLEIKSKLVKLLLADTLSNEIFHVLEIDYPKKVKFWNRLLHKNTKTVIDDKLLR